MSDADRSRVDQLNAAVALVAATGPDPGSVWRHRAGGVYRVVCCAVREADRVPVVVYQSETPAGLTAAGLQLSWVRPLAEFTDGRFALVAPGPGGGR